MEWEERNDVVKTWLKDLSTVLKVELELDSAGICTFQIGEDIIITIEVSRDFPMVNLYSSLVAFPSDDVDTAVLMMAKALELNAFQALTRGGAIASIAGEGILIFCYTMPIENGNSELFNAILGNFYDTVVDLKAILLAIAALDSSKAKSLDDLTEGPKKAPLMMIKI